MNPIIVFNLIALLGQKAKLTEPEYCLYNALCENMELWVKYSSAGLRKELDQYESQDPTDGDAHSAP